MKLARIVCILKGHRYRTMRPLMIGGDLIQCERCGLEMCIHHGRRQIIPYDSDIEKLEIDMRKLLARFQDRP